MPNSRVVASTQRIIVNSPGTLVRVVNAGPIGPPGFGSSSGSDGPYDISTVSGLTYTPVLTDQTYKTLKRMSSVDTQTYTIPAASAVPWVIGRSLFIWQADEGQTVIQGSGTAEILNDLYTTAGKNAFVEALYVGVDEWLLIGDLADDNITPPPPEIDDWRWIVDNNGDWITDANGDWVITPT